MPEGRRSIKIFSAAALLFLFLGGMTARAQTQSTPQTRTGTQAQTKTGGILDDRAADNVVWEGRLRRRVEALCDTLTDGRATGTRGGTEAAFALMRDFRAAGLLPLSGVYTRAFYAKDSTVVGHNVMGLLPGSDRNPAESYVIVAAHYDHIGSPGGRLYPGADSNASGTAALVTLAEMFASMRDMGRTMRSSVIFIALDGHTFSTTGAYALWNDIEKGRLRDPLTGRHITSDKVRLMVNIDQIGSSLSPLRSGRPDYLIMLGAESLPSDCRNLLSLCNRSYGTGLELSDTYYGSENFTRLFYSISDQRPFVENSMPAVMFTSGITMNNNKPADVPSTLNYPVLRRRILLIYHWLDRIIPSLR